MDQLTGLAGGDLLEPRALLDIFLTAVLIYIVLRLIQGTRAVRLAIGATIVYVVYLLALELDLRLLSGILQTGAVVGLVALVVVFQPELRRALDRLGRVGSWGWIERCRPRQLPAHLDPAGQFLGQALATAYRGPHRDRARHRPR